MVTPVGARELRFFLGTDGTDHGRAERLQPLAGNQAYASGCRVEEHRHSRLDTKCPPQQVLGGHPFQHHGGGLLVGHGIRDLHDPVAGHPAGLAVGTRGRRGVGDPITGAKSRDAGTDLLDHAGSLETDGPRQVW